MRRVDLLINQIRRQTENEEFSSTTGIGNDEFLQYLNDAQHRLQSVILQQHPTVFVDETEFSAVNGQGTYNIPSDAFLANKVAMLEYSPSGRSDDYYPLELTVLKSRSTNVTGEPLFYARRSGKVLVSPIPQNSVGKFRMNYIKRIEQLDLRRGEIGAVSLNTSTKKINSLVIEAASPINSTFDTTNLSNAEYLCIVDKNGNIKMKNIPVDALNTSTGEVTVDSAFVYSNGESITVGDFVVNGLDTSTHSSFPRSVERYLIAYCAWKILKRDSSVDNAEQTQELLAMEQDITATYADLEEDVQTVPILNDWIFD